MKNRKIIGYGYYIPKNLITNQDLEKIVDTNDEWIKSRSGIETRYVSSDENTSDIAYNAAIKAIEDANISKEDIDLIICATCTPDNMTPSTACLVQEKLGLNDCHVTAFDLNAACSGFLYSMQVAALMLSEYKCALVIGAETLSKVIDWTDRSTCVLFGDGAGAVIMKREQTDNQMYFYSNAEGDSQGKLKIRGLSLKQPLQNEAREVGCIEMAGNDVFRFAVRAMSEALKEALKKADKTIDQIDLVIPHQANYRIIKHVIKKLKIDENKVYINLDKYGNTSAASVAIAIAEAKEKGLIKEGAKVVLIGFGAGFTYASGYIEI